MQVNNSTPSIRMNMQATTDVRKTADTSFGAKLNQGLSAGANALGGAAQMAAPYLPGGNVISAALSNAKGAIGSSSSALTAGSANSAASPLGAASGSGSGATALPSSVSGNTSSGSMQSQFDQTKEMMQMQAGMNLQFLNLQNNMQNEQRTFTTISNVMKTRHDTAKNTIQKFQA